MIKDKLLQHKEAAQDARRVLYQHRDDVTGQALSKLLTIHLEQSRAKLERVSQDELLRVQGEVAAYRKLLNYQHEPDPSIQS